MAGTAAPDEGAGRIRVDKWLWQARFLRSRALAATLAASGRLRINGTHCAKPAQMVRPGDVLTFPQGGRIRVIRIEAIGARRGPATEAAGLYCDLDPPAAEAADAGSPGEAGPGARDPGTGRPTKRARREIDMLRRNAS